MQIDPALARGIGKTIAKRRATAAALDPRTTAWSDRDVARRMTDAGHPMQHSAVIRARKGQRTVSAQEWLTFSLVFSVTPLSLIDPEQESVNLAGEAHERESFAAWFAGRRPLDSVEEPAQFYASAGATRGPIESHFAGVLRAYADHLETTTEPVERLQVLGDIARASLDQMRADERVQQYIEARNSRAQKKGKEPK